MRAVIALLALAIPLAGCGAKRVGGVELPAERVTDWRVLATVGDRTRMRDARQTWLTALAAARTADPAAVAREPLLFAPDRALPGAIPPYGTYRCRTFKLGAKGTATRGFTVYPWRACTVEDRDGTIRFAADDGPQRPKGAIFPDGTARGVFLGTLELGDESRALDYGRDAARDLVGIVERVGERRWRIAFPAPRFESQMDVIEIVPAG